MSRDSQGSLFGSPEAWGRRFDSPPLNVLSRIKTAMRRAAGASRFSRAEIVDRMNAFAEEEGILARRGKKFSLAALEGWLAQTKNNLPDPEALVLFSAAAESLLPLAALAGSLEAAVIDQGKLRILEWAETELAIRRLNRRRRQLEPEV